MATATAWTDDVTLIMRSDDHLTWLGAVLESIAIDALRQRAPTGLGSIRAGQIHSVIGRPVAAAAEAAIDRLATDLAAVISHDASAASQHAAEERRRVELGLD